MFLSRSTKQQQLEFLIETSATVPSVNVRNSRMAAVPEDTNVFQTIPMSLYFIYFRNAHLRRKDIISLLTHLPLNQCISPSTSASYITVTVSLLAQKGPLSTCLSFRILRREAGEHLMKGMLYRISQERPRRLTGCPVTCGITSRTSSSPCPSWLHAEEMVASI